MLGGLVLGLPWVSDGISDHETSAITVLLGLGEVDVVLAEKVSVFPWVTDGIDKEISEDGRLRNLRGFRVWMSGMHGRLPRSIG